MTGTAKGGRSVALGISTVGGEFNLVNRTQNFLDMRDCGQPRSSILITILGMINPPLLAIKSRFRLILGWKYAPLSGSYLVEQGWS